MIYIFIALLSIAVSGGLGMYLDIKIDYQNNVMYWLIGAIGGIIAGFVITHGALKSSG